MRKAFEWYKSHTEEIYIAVVKVLLSVWIALAAMVGACLFMNWLGGL